MNKEFYFVDRLQNLLQKSLKELLLLWKPISVLCPKFERMMCAIILPDKLETEATEKGDDKIQ